MMLKMLMVCVILTMVESECDFDFDADVGKSVEFFHTVDEGIVGGYSTQPWLNWKMV